MLNAARAIAGMLRARLVAITPGWIAFAVLPVPANRRDSSLANNRLASFDCPYAAHAE